jgi:hypothetical protein
MSVISFRFIRLKVICWDFWTGNHFTVFERVLFFDATVEELQLTNESI